MLNGSSVIRKICSTAIAMLIAGGSSAFCLSASAENSSVSSVNLSDMTYVTNGKTKEMKVYSQDDFDDFVKDYNNNTLDELYVTQFLYDGAGMVKTPDLDDFIEDESNDAKIKTLSLTVVNVNQVGNIKFSGELKGGMIAVNTNGVKDDINLVLDGVNIDTDSKKAPAVYVYNKDINYTDCKVTIKTAFGTENYLEGGKFKKVSLVGSDELDKYSGSYSGSAKSNYETYSNYYGIYTSEQIENILFAKVQADSEDLADGDPYYFYKGAGAVSSDIDLYFEGEGYLSVVSKNKEGIETKGNLTLSGGTGDYYVYSEDDCLNTTTSGGGFGSQAKQSNSNIRNTMTIDVSSLTAIVSPNADEGDAIDSNGYLYINGGKIVAMAHPTSQDDGLDSEYGTYINGGTVAATGNMSDTISNESKQQFMKLSFAQQQAAETLICVTDKSSDPVMAFKSDRTYKVLTLSSPDLSDGTYYVYRSGTIAGTENSGLYTDIASYSNGIQQQWSGGNQFGGGGKFGQGEKFGGGKFGGNDTDSPDKTGSDMPTPPDMSDSDMPTPPDMGGGDMPTPPDMSDSDMPTPPDMSGSDMPTPPGTDGSDTQTSNGTASVEFTLSSSSHNFGNVKDNEKSSETDTSKHLLGDVNNDSVIDSADALIILRAAVQLEKFDEQTTKLADVDGDSDITSGDSLYVLRYSVGLKDDYKIGEALK